MLSVQQVVRTENITQKQDFASMMLGIKGADAEAQTGDGEVQASQEVHAGRGRGKATKGKGQGVGGRGGTAGAAGSGVIGRKRRGRKDEEDEEVDPLVPEGYKPVAGLSRTGRKALTCPTIELHEELQEQPCQELLEKWKGFFQHGPKDERNAISAAVLQEGLDAAYMYIQEKIQLKIQDGMCRMLLPDKHRLKDATEKAVILANIIWTHKDRIMAGLKVRQGGTGAADQPEVVELGTQEEGEIRGQECGEEGIEEGEEDM
jgi:hypothetical protein